jgi:copper chaperone CopZ
VKKALEGLKGVEKADVSFAEKRATVTYDPAKVSVEDMVKAVSQAGFRATEMVRK